MKTIHIKAKEFFDMLKLKDISMWDIFAELINGEEKEMIFIDEEGNILFNYILPKSMEQLHNDKKQFAKEYTNKLSELN